MSFDPNGQRGIRETKTERFINDPNLMSEKTKLPDLDYKKLAMARLSMVKRSDKAPTGRYDTLVAYLQQRGTQVDAAEVDRRCRTWFEDIINRILTNPAEWDAERTLNGKALMDFLSGVKAEQAPPTTPPGGQQP